MADEALQMLEKASKGGHKAARYAFSLISILLGGESKRDGIQTIGEMKVTSSIKFSGSSIVLEPVKLRGFILKNSRILEVSASSCRAPLCCPTWLVTAWLNIRIASRNSTLVTSP
ncbi:hypothetical protein H5410_014306 [Solanum commersonii]|uniref:At2g35280-like TPR domain-containing protein n=1 Tax=Solanum commersonii TaxID=4109 RepID=A0A9J5ZQZ4_SOLCO|nr:hypothetical protein H5410_014306 [Solanum commersonii]